MLIGHGDDIPQNITANFSSNVWYGANNEELYKYLADHLKDTSRYPEIFPNSFTKKISEYHNLSTNHITVTNGATEAIYLIAHIFAKTYTGIVCPSFSEYEDACKLHNHKLNYIDETNFTANIKVSDRLIFMGNPNNPTGKAYNIGCVESLLQNNPNSIFVIDEAYSDFTMQNCSAIGLIDKYPNLIIIRSLTKTFCIPGLRLGYIVASQKYISKIDGFKMPWSVNTLAIKAGEYLFDSIADYQIPLQNWIDETHWLMEKIIALKNFNVLPSNTTYFLCETLQPNASLLKQYLLNEYAILIRDASNFRSLTPNHLRICTQTHAENEQLINGLKKWTTAF